MAARAVVAAVVAGLVLAAVPALAAGPAPRVPGAREGLPEGGIHAYKGKLVDESGKPISGIFPMTFKLYAGLKAKSATWSETLWVAVDRGIYTVALGAAKPLPKRDDLDRMVLGVEIKGFGELVREPFVPAEVKPPVLSAGPAPTPGAAAAAAAQALARGAGAPSSGSAKYADTAGFAVESDHAKNSDRLQNLTLDEVVRRAAEESGAGAGGGGAGGKVKLGGSKRFGARVGGPGGTGEYNESCPKGYVMTGIRGGAGNFVDSIQIICSPLE